MVMWPVSLPDVAIVIGGGVNFYLRAKGSIRIESAIERRSTASFTIVDQTGAWSFSRGQQVEILKAGFPPFPALLFGGVIWDVKEQRVPVSDVIYHHVRCVDYHYLADKRLAAATYTSSTAGAIVTDLLADYLADEGVTAGTIQAGPTIDETTINYVPVSKALDALATQAGFIWEIDYYKRLNFQVRTTTTAPFTVSADDVVKPSSSLAHDSNQYRNRQYVRAGKDVTDSQVETYTGDGVQESFTVGYPINSVPTVTVNAVGQTVGIKGIDDSFDCYWSKGDPVIVFDAGSIPGAVAVVITYVGEYDIITQAEDEAEIVARAAVEGGSGITEAMHDEPGLNSRDASWDVGLALLTKYATIGQQFRFAIKSYGLLPGQIVTVTYDDYGYAATDLLIESVRITEPEASELRFDIKAILGPVMGDWTTFFGNLAGRIEDVAGRLTIGDNSVVIILKRLTEDWEWDESVVENVYACTTCNGTVVGGTTPVVC